jgi:hypothetical protein
MNKDLLAKDLIKLAKKYSISTDLVLFLNSKVEGTPYYRKLNKAEKGILSIKKMYDFEKDSLLVSWKRDVEEELYKDLTFTVHTENKYFSLLSKLSALIVPPKEEDLGNTLNKYLTKYFANDKVVKGLFLTWFYLWPNPDTNKGWNTLFGVTYKGVVLRRADQSKFKFFIKIIKNEYIDVSLFIIAAYLFIRNGVRDGKTFIPKTDRFIHEWEEWYEIAQTRTNELGEANLIRLFDLNEEQVGFKEGSVSSGFRRG